MIKKTLFEQKDLCCGCEACASICPKHVISMERDEEGFYYPRVIAADNCINCNLCIDVCPVKNYSELHSSFTVAYAGHAVDDSISIGSSSGGFATVLSKEFIKATGGVCYGVAYDNDFMTVHYCKADSIDKLYPFQTSKYSQARKKDVFEKINEDLETKKVLFVGTPCDAYALLRYTNYPPNLFVITLICHGPTSEKIHSMFCSLIENKYNSKLQYLSLRYKKDGKWKPYYIKATFINGKEYIHKFDDSLYNTAFLYYKRPSCSTCKFKKDRFAGDILIGDYHSANPGTDVYYEHGVSSILPLTEKGIYLFDLIKDTFVYKEVSIDSSIGQQAVHSPVVKNINRSLFTEKLCSEGFEEACGILSIRYDKTKSRIKKVIRGYLGRCKRKILGQLNK